MLITIIYSAIYIYSLFLPNINLFCKIIMLSYTSYLINILLSTILHTRIHTCIYTSYSEHIGSNKKCPIGKKKEKGRERERFGWNFFTVHGLLSTDCFLFSSIVKLSTFGIVKPQLRFLWYVQKTEVRTTERPKITRYENNTSWIVL